ncbi:hypothetical protein Taro_056492 [Colocasia esculenta]|uniref:Uncharacterized protein n=1 Tax=Colocasia esculenta TaxID=4460 RepID=A0A843XTN4_COLES|nr:hypothetical protein [Colocasia esculenta]
MQSSNVANSNHKSNHSELAIFKVVWRNTNCVSYVHLPATEEPTTQLEYNEHEGSDTPLSTTAQCTISWEHDNLQEQHGHRHDGLLQTPLIKL